MTELSDRDRDLLTFEGSTTWRYTSNKAEVIRELFGLSLTGYAQILNAVCDTREALEFAPAVVRRIKPNGQVAVGALNGHSDQDHNNVDRRLRAPMQQRRF